MYVCVHVCSVLTRCRRLVLGQDRLRIKGTTHLLFFLVQAESHNKSEDNKQAALGKKKKKQTRREKLERGEGRRGQEQSKHRQRLIGSPTAGPSRYGERACPSVYVLGDLLLSGPFPPSHFCRLFSTQPCCRGACWILALMTVAVAIAGALEMAMPSTRLQERRGLLLLLLLLLVPQ